MNDFSRHFMRLYHSSVVWLWVFNGLRLGSGLLLLPLLALKLSKPDLGMYIVFLNLGALVPIIDFGFSVSIGRNISYAMGGAKELKPHGISASKSNEPNFPLLWQLLHATRRLYRYLFLLALIFLGSFGTIIVALRINETSVPVLAWWAWAIALAAAIWEIYAGWWSTFLRSMNNVLLSARLSVLAYGLQLVIACVLLMYGAGLLSVPVASLFSSLLQRHFARRACLKFLNDKPSAELKLNLKELLSVIWPSSWRTGVQYVSGYLSSNAAIFICLTLFGLEASAKYGLSIRIITIIQGMAAVWTVAKWPLIGQLRARDDFDNLQKLFRPRLQLQLITFVLMAAVAVPFSPFLLKWIGSDKEVLPILWLALLALNSLLEMHYSVWGTLIFMENRMPYLWPVVITSVANLPASLLLINYTELGLASFVIAPLITGTLYNYWRWPMEGAKSLKTTWSRFMLTPQTTL